MAGGEVLYHSVMVVVGGNHPILGGGVPYPVMMGVTHPILDGGVPYPVMMGVPHPVMVGVPIHT